MVNYLELVICYIVASAFPYCTVFIYFFQEEDLNKDQIVGI